MKLSIVSIILSFTCAAVADIWPGFEKLPNGAYAGKINPDGSVKVSEVILDNSVPAGFTIGQTHTFPVERTSSPSRVRATITQRDIAGHCFDSFLDHSGVDIGNSQLQAWAGNGRDFYGHDFFGYNNNGVYVYYCILWDAHGNLSAADVREAFGAMDAACHAYQSSYARWGDGPELVGKSPSGFQVCVN